MTTITNTRTIHYAIESDGMFGSTDTGPVCGYNFHRRKTLTDDWRKVTCGQCITLMGLDQLTQTVGDPLLNARAA